MVVKVKVGREGSCSEATQGISGVDDTSDIGPFSRLSVREPGVASDIEGTDIELPSRRPFLKGQNLGSAPRPLGTRQERVTRCGTTDRRQSGPRRGRGIRELTHTEGICTGSWRTPTEPKSTDYPRSNAHCPGPSLNPNDRHRLAQKLDNIEKAAVDFLSDQNRLVAS